LRFKGKIYIGKDFPDEFAHGKDKTVLKVPNQKENRT